MVRTTMLRVRDRVAVLVWDNGTCLTPGVVVSVSNLAVKVIVRRALGYEVLTFGYDGNLLDYVTPPEPSMLDNWAGHYVTLDMEASKHCPPEPQGGDVVRLVTPWRVGNVPAGSLGVINGKAGQSAPFMSITFNSYTIFRDRKRYGVVAAQGGPSTLRTTARELKVTENTMTLDVWDWGDNPPGPGKNVSYRVRVPVWEWSPKE